MVLPGASTATNETASRIETARVVVPMSDQCRKVCVPSVQRMMRLSNSSHHRSVQRTLSLRVSTMLSEEPSLQ